MQCRLLGTRVEAWREDGAPSIDEEGDLVVTAAMPSMPVRLWNDPDGRRYQDTYFDTFPGVWRHGDWLTITRPGTPLGTFPGVRADRGWRTPPPPRHRHRARPVGLDDQPARRPAGQRGH